MNCRTENIATLGRKVVTAIALTLLSGILTAQTLYRPGDLLVSSRGTDAVIWYDSTGSSLGFFVTPGLGGLSAPQEILIHPSGDIIVTGRWNSSLKRYDGLSGDFVGDFSSGYDLDQPTKTQIGPDSLIWVAQWGTQNKIARFDLETGAFVDEITEIGVYQGMGMAWTSGSWFVCSWNEGTDGFVQAFSYDGTDLGFLLEGSDLDGPVNLWLDDQDSSRLWIADWSRGDVLVYDIDDGMMVDTPVSTLQRLEGYAFDRHGRLYLGDWLANRIYRYDRELDELEVFTSTGGVVNPNGILIVPDEEAPVEPPTAIETPEQLWGPVNYSIINLHGQIVARGYSIDGRQLDSVPTETGFYVIRFEYEEGDRIRWLMQR